MDFDRSVFAAEFIAAGIWSPIRVINSQNEATDGSARYRRPDLDMGRSITTDHEIKYQATDFPDLAEGDVVQFLDAAGEPIVDKVFRVRQSPIVVDDASADTSGHFMRALLTHTPGPPSIEYSVYLLLEDDSRFALE